MRTASCSQVLVPAVLQALREQNGGGSVQPLLFAAASATAEHEGASSSFQYRFFQNSSPAEVFTQCCHWLCYGHPHTNLQRPAYRGAAS
jgi:hypothetical protein